MKRLQSATFNKRIPIIHPHYKRIATRSLQLLGVCLTLLLLNSLLAWHLLSSPVDRLADALAGGDWPFEQPRAQASVTRIRDGIRRREGTVSAGWDGNRFDLEIEAWKRRGGLSADSTSTRIWMAGEGRGGFVGESTGLTETRAAWTEVRDLIRDPRRWKLAVFARPLITGLRHREGEWIWRLRFQGGHADLSGGWPRRLRLRLPGKRDQWEMKMSYGGDALHPPSNPPVPISGWELDAGLAEWVRIAALQTRPVRRDEDGIWHEGAGHLRIRDGRRTAYFEGSAYEIGFQHGTLLRASATQLIRRTLYGIGLYYSLEKGEWFPSAAHALFQRQLPFIPDSIQEEMRGFAKGAGLSLEQVQAVNQFPEFFHCTGVVAFGSATKDGHLYHSRVLDYLMHIGLQDEALVMAVRRAGAIPFVSVGYSGFLGTVTGMNEEGIAIGQVGGARGSSLDDGTPMSFLLRGMLEKTRTVAEAVRYLQERPRTAEFYYIISDAESSDAVALYATPERLDVIRPGETHPTLEQPLEDTIMVAGKRRYGHLVERVRQHHGEIDAELLFEIGNLPVAMEDNLHSIVFSPRTMEILVANAGRFTPANDRIPLRYSWSDLFQKEVK